MSVRIRRGTAVVLAAALALTGCALTGCAGPTVPPAPPAGTGAISAGPLGGTAVRLPQFPVPRVPDVSSLTAAAARTEKLITGSVSLPPGVVITGARCDPAGNVVNRTGATLSAADDGSQVSTRAGTRQLQPDGSGQFTDGDVTYQVAADGSGQVSSGQATLQVSADGSGQYTDGSITYQVSADGSGQYSNGTETYQVSADGSGQWTGPAGVVHNDGKGGGTWAGGQGAVTVNGDGTGTVNGRLVKIDPMPKFALLGRFPKLAKLAPLGRPCGVLIRLGAEVLFDFDKATLRPEAGPVLAAIATALRASGAAVDVNGHTDSIGTEAYNLDLSLRRAKAVIAALVADGVTGTITPHGYGESQPVAPNTTDGKDNPAGRQLNRRVEIVIRGG